MASTATTPRASKAATGSRSLRRDPEFFKLWSGEAVSQVGGQVTLLALPLTAALLLEATPSQMGLLGAAQTAPFLLLALPAGVWVDRTRRRPVLIAANLGRAVLLGLIPMLALLGALRMWHLYGIAFLVGAFAVCFDLAFFSYLPGLVGRGRLVDANAKLQGSASVAEIGGPGLEGVLAGVFSAPLAMALAAASFGPAAWAR